MKKDKDKKVDLEVENQEIDENLEDTEAKATLKADAEEEDVEDPIKELEDRVSELEDLRLRDLAEFENIKKRVEKEKTQAVAYAHESFARDLLAVIDSLENANAAMENLDEVSVEKMKEGIELTIEQFKKVFEKHGIELIDLDSGFDPNFHEAVMRVDSDEHDEGEIVQVLQKGYKIRERVLRPAMVSIAK